MPLIKTQQYVYVNEALSSLFHTTPELFIKYLNDDGKSFLRFWWEQVGENVEKASHAAGEQIDFEMHTVDDVTLVVIKLPRPRLVGEAFFIGLIYRPVKVRLFLRKALTRFIVLESNKDKNDDYGTLVVERTAMKRRRVLATGPKDPGSSQFYRILLDMVETKNKQKQPA